jgi:hypothetical protein
MRIIINNLTICYNSIIDLRGFNNIMTNIVKNQINTDHSYHQIRAGFNQDCKGLLGGREITLRELEVETDKHFTVYASARESILNIAVLGNAEIRGDISLITNLGTAGIEPCSETASKVSDYANSHLQLNDELPQAHFNRGSIIVDTDWTLLGNDAFILGGIHSGKEFHIGLPGMPQEENLWSKDPAYPGPRVLARELLMLVEAGYKIHDFGNGNGVVFYKPESVDTSKVTLQSCRAALKDITSAEQILQKLEAARDDRITSS